VKITIGSRQSSGVDGCIIHIEFADIGIRGVGPLRRIRRVGIIKTRVGREGIIISRAHNGVAIVGIIRWPAEGISFPAKPSAIGIIIVAVSSRVIAARVNGSSANNSIGRGKIHPRD